MKQILIKLFSLLALIFVGCTADLELSVTADFITDKESYRLGEPVIIINQSSADNTQIAVYKWDLGKGQIIYTETPDPLYFTEAGNFEISLTVTSSEGALKSTAVRSIAIVDDNTRPVADFEYMPLVVTAGEPVQFTDLSTDSDGEIVKWEWSFGTTKSTEQNPTFTFASNGEQLVTLKVTDNNLGSNTKEVTIDVARGAYNIDMVWSHSYDDTEDAYVFGTSPAVSPDGEFVYVTSTGYDLVAFTKDGERAWTFDIGQNGASALSSSGHIQVQSPTPSVGDDGVVYAAAGFNEPKNLAFESGLFAIYGGATSSGGGAQKWYASLGGGTSLRFFAPAITDKHIIVAHRNAPTNKHFEAFDKATGAYVSGMHANAGSYGGILAMKSGMVIAGTGGGHGTRVYFPVSDGVWRFSPNNSTSSRDHNYGATFVPGSTTRDWETPNGTQPAAGPGNKIYILFKNTGSQVSTSGGVEGIVYCYDANKTIYGEMPTPEWVCGVKGGVEQLGMGVVLGEDGTIYAATSKRTSSAAHITAVSSSGTMKWEHAADGDINGVPAVDNEGYVYYCDRETGKLVKLDPLSGSRVAELTLADEIRSSPAISSDGTIYVNGMKGGKPTVFAVKASATSHADSWSQLGGNPSKSSYMY